MIITLLGMVIAFGTMIWFGLGRAFGLDANSILDSGIYRYSRNPQMLGAWLMVIGVFVYSPSFYGLGWMVIWAFIGHWMVKNEEIHLRRVFGEEYDLYFEKTPRYLF